MDAERSPDLPNLIGETIYFDPNKLIDQWIIEFDEQIIENQLPSLAKQKKLIRKIHSGDKSAALEFIQKHKGLIAIPARIAQSINPKAKDNRLLRTGMQALIEAATTYPLQNEKNDFNDYAVAKVCDSLGLDADLINGVPEEMNGCLARPMEQVMQYAAALSPAIEEHRRQKEKNEEVLSKFTKGEKETLQLLYLPRREIAKKTKRSLSSVQNSITSSMSASGTNSVVDLALRLQEQGYRYNIPAPDQHLADVLSDEDFFIGHNLRLSNKMLAEKLQDILPGITEDDVKERVTYLRKKLCNVSRVYAALAIKMYDTGERRQSKEFRLRKFAEETGRIILDSHDLEPYDLTPNQKEVLSLYYFNEPPLSIADISHRLNMNKASIRRLRKLGLEVLGTE